jgi:flagellar hook-associated protein 3 FlgL
MQIGTKQLFDSSLHRMTSLSAGAARLQTEIATGTKLQAASDDSVAFDRLTRLKRNLANEDQYASNVNAAATLLQQSDTALEGIEIQVQRAREIAIAASNDTMTPADRKALGIELNAILDTMMELANASDARGQPLFAGAGAGPAFSKDADGTVMWTGEGEAPPIPIGLNVTIQAADSGARLFGGISTASGTTDMFAIVQNLARALDGTAPADPALGETAQAQLRARLDAGLDGLAAATDRVASNRASVGARGARLEIETERLADLSTTREIERSGLEDADVTEAIARLQQTMLALEATQASFARLSQMSLFDYIR